MNSPASIYTQHDKAFAQTSAYAILHNGSPVAKIAFKFPKDGAGRLYAYVHWLGLPMTRGYASGYGYDKRTAALASATKKALYIRIDNEPAAQFWSALEKDQGDSFDAALRKAGFEVFQTV